MSEKYDSANRLYIKDINECFGTTEPTNCLGILFLYLLMVVVMVVVVGGTQSLLHLPSFFQALPVVVVGVPVVGVPVVVGGVVGGGSVVVVAAGEMVLHAYVAPAATATLEPAPWLDIGIYQILILSKSNSIQNFNIIKINFNDGHFSYFL